MKIFSLVLIALIAGSAIADTVNCNDFKQQDLCPDTSCTFSPDNANTNCVTKCTILDSKACGENQKDCTSNPASCKVKATLGFDCTKSTADQATCQKVNAACNWVAATDATCVKKADTDKTCQGYTTADTCQADKNCSGKTDKTCTYKPDQCTNQKTLKDCNTDFCNQQFKSCAAKVSCNTQVQAECKVDQGCSWDDTTKCSDSCASKQTIKDCGDASATCDLTFTCSDNDQTTKCVTDSCNDTFCTAADKYTCATVAGLCGDVTTCQNFSGCTYTAGTASQCNNPTKCTSTNPEKCDDYCEATLFSCTASNADTCNKTLTTSDKCTQAGFCSFVQYGTCATKDTNAALLTFSALITLFALLF